MCGVLSQLGKLSLYFTLYETAAAKALLKQLKAESDAKKNNVSDDMSSERSIAFEDEGTKASLNWYI